MVAAARWAAQQSRGTNADTAASWHTSHTVAHTRTRRLPPVTLPIVAHGRRPRARCYDGRGFPDVLTSGVRTLLSLGFLASTLGAPFEATAGQSTPVLEPVLALADGPPPPVGPEVIARDAEGRATIRAIRLQEPFVADGDLNESLYRDVPGMTGFTQVEPRAGEPAVARTETWLSFDDDNVYVSFRCFDSDMERLVATEMRRDSNVMWQGNDIVVFVFDTFYDRRNSILFVVNALGGRQDGQVVNERQYLGDWNPVWTVKSGRFDGGWTVEAVVPFKSLRYRPGREQIWGFNAMRVKRSTNEISTLTRVPPARGQTGVQQASLAASVVGLQAPTSGALLDLKPFATSSAATGRCTGNAIGGRVDRCWDAGFDAKYAVTQNLSADFTYNTDFAQVEADEQQVNLTRFSLFFPEKREFFLENQGVFAFGGVPLSGQQAGSGAPILFYSRRIGLQGNQTVPIEAGGRLTGRAGTYQVGLLNIQSDGDPRDNAGGTNFTVVRARRDLFGRSSIGLMATNRSVAQSGMGPNQAYGLDGTFAFYENLFVNAYWARTETPGLHGGSSSYRGQLDYAGDRYGVQLERVAIGDNFNPEIGFVRRDDMVRDYAFFRFSPRPRSRRLVRKYYYQGYLEYIENTRGVMESRARDAEFAIEFQNADRVSLVYRDNFEFLPRPFLISPGVTLPVGPYDFQTLIAGYNMGQQRALSANISVEVGTFYNGDKTTLNIARGRAKITNQISAEPTYSYNRVSLVEGDFTTHLFGSRLTYTVTPMMFASALVQYNSGVSAVSTNARLRWEYQPGSELFVVYNEERNTLAPGFPNLTNRSFIVKFNRLFRF